MKTISVPTAEYVDMYYSLKHNKVYKASGAGLFIIDCRTDSVIANPVAEAVGPTICYDALRDHVYCGTGNIEHSLVAIDGAGDTIVWRIQLPPYSGPWCLYYDSLYDRIYSLNGCTNTVSVVDPEEGRVLFTHPLVGGPKDIIYNPASRSVYCANEEWPVGHITVVDCSTSTIRRRIAVDGGARALCFGPLGNSVFCVNYYNHTVAVIDGTGDSICATVTLNGGPVALCWSQTSNKAYCANQYSNNVTVIDGETNRILKSIPVGDQPLSLCYNSVNDRVHCGVSGSQHIVTISCANDSVVATVAVSGPPRGICYSGENNRAYCAVHDYTLGKVAVLDGETNQLVAQVATGPRTNRVCYNPVSNKVYAANPGNNTVSVIDCSTNTVRATLTVSGTPSALCCNPRDNKVYCLTSGNLTVIDGAGDYIRAELPHFATPACATALCYNSTDNKVYGAWHWSYREWWHGCVSVYDGQADTIIARGELPGFHPTPCSLLYNPMNNKVYCADSRNDVVYVIDGTTNSVVRSVGVPGSPRSFAWNSTDNRTYVNCFGASQIAVLRDSLVQGVREATRAAGSMADRLPTVVRGVLRLPQSGDRKPRTAALLDITGRHVADLTPGPNDIRHLSPGVYFILTPHPHPLPQGEREWRLAVRKVVIQR